MSKYIAISFTTNAILSKGCLGMIFSIFASKVPLELYLKRGKAKLTIAVCKGKKNYDKRDALKEKELNKKMERY